MIYIDRMVSSREMGRVHKDGEKSMEGVRLCWMVLEGRKESSRLELYGNYQGTTLV